jgi:hypothetical protein
MWQAWKRRTYKDLVGNLNERDDLENLDVDGSITILKFIPKK